MNELDKRWILRQEIVKKTQMDGISPLEVAKEVLQRAKLLPSKK